MDQEHKRKQSFLLRLPVSVREQATQVAREEGTSLNHFISLAVAEKLSRMTPTLLQMKSPLLSMDERSHTDFRSLQFHRIAS